LLLLPLEVVANHNWRTIQAEWKGKFVAPKLLPALLLLQTAHIHFC